MKRLILLFSVSVLLIVQHLEAQTAVTDTVFLQLYNDSVDLNEVVVKGKRTPVANSRWSDMSPVELVTVGGADTAGYAGTRRKWTSAGARRK